LVVAARSIELSAALSESGKGQKKARDGRCEWAFLDVDWQSGEWAMGFMMT
jgi:hypothetical protein